MSVHKISDVGSEHIQPENHVHIDAWFAHAEESKTIAVVDLDTLMVIPVKRNLMADPLVIEAIEDVLREERQKIRPTQRFVGTMGR